MSISALLCAFALGACGGGDASTIEETPGASLEMAAAAHSASGGSSAVPDTALLDLAASAQASTFSAPLRITRGGTYSGNWESQNTKLAAITIATSEPVLIQNCKIKGRGVLVDAPSPGANVTVRNCEGLGLNPNAAGIAHGRFFSAYKPSKVVIERNSLQDTAGIYVDGAGGQSHGISVRFNRSRNIEGRLSNGAAGGYSSRFTRVQFLQLNSVRASRNVVVAWNEVINEPRQSRVEDNINLYLSSGTPDSPILIRNNYIRGGYPADPAHDSYSGGGIIVDGNASSMQTSAGYIDISDNQVVATTNYGVAISAGHHVQVQRNRVVASGRTADGQRIAAANVGIYVWDMNGNARKGTFHHHSMSQNFAGWTDHGGSRNDYWTPDCGGTVVCNPNASAPGSVTKATEDAEYAIWSALIRKQGISVGAQP
jgi:hypothetical protein